MSELPSPNEGLVLWYLRSLKVKIVQKWLFLTWNGTFMTENEIRDFQKYLYLNGKDKLCQYPKYHPLLCLFYGTQVFKRKKSKMVFFWPEMAHFWPKIKSENFESICIWTAGTNCASTRSIIQFYVFFMVSEVFKSESSPKLAIFDLKWAIFDQKWNPRFSKIFVSERQGQTVPVPEVSSTSMSFLWYLRSSKVKIVQK